MKRNIVVIAALCLTLLGLSSLYLGKAADLKVHSEPTAANSGKTDGDAGLPERKTESTNRAVNGKKIDRGLQKGSTKNKNNIDYSPIISRIQEYTSDKTGKYGIYFIDLTSGQRFGMNEDAQFVAASTVKVPVNLYLYTLIAEKKEAPETLLTYTEEDYEEGTGSIQNEEYGKQYSLKELSRLSIEESDNVAVNMIIRHLSLDNIHEFMEKVQKHPIEREHNVSTPKEMAFYMEAVLDFQKQHKQEGDELISFLENTEFNDRIPRNLPKDTVIAHKIGTQVGIVNDVGIVFTDRPYILSVMSEDVDEEEAPAVIGIISKIIYEFQQQ